MCSCAEKIHCFAKRLATQLSQPASETSILPLFIAWSPPVRSGAPDLPTRLFWCGWRADPPTCKVLVNSNFNGSIFAVEHRGSLSAPIHCRPKSFTCLAARGDLARAADIQVNRVSFTPALLARISGGEAGTGQLRRFADGRE
jgi:hypothetical protein